MDPFDARTWVRWDSGIYLAIAEHGYFIEHCRPESHYPATAWCGNTGWFPAFSWALAALSRLGPSPEAAGAAIAAACHFGTLWMVWNWFLRGRPSRRNLVALALSAVFPGGIYYQAVFPVSLFLFCAVGFLRGLQRQRWALAFACAAGAALVYGSGVLLAAVGAFWWATQEGGARRPHVLLASAGALLGFATVLAVQRAQTGVWNGYFLVQSHYGYSLTDPLDTLFSRIKPLLNAHYRTALSAVTAAQTALVTTLVSCAAAQALRRRRSSAARLVFVCTAAYWLFPLTVGGGVSLYRAESLLLPSIYLVRRSRMGVLVAFTIVAALLSIAMAAAFFRSQIV